METRARFFSFMEGKLTEHPLAELIREVTTSGLTGALRLARERTKVAVYFESGQLVFATSNLRAYRLREVAKRHGLTEAHLAEFPTSTHDSELAVGMLKSKTLQPETLAAIRAQQVSDVLRLALLWVGGSWEFDPRVRLADETRVQIDVNRLLLECARHLPADFVAKRIESAGGTFQKVANNNGENLLPAEKLILNSTLHSMTVPELTPLSKDGSEEAYRAIYALSLSGLLERSDWPVALAVGTSVPVKTTARQERRHTVDPAAVETNELADAESLFARLKVAKLHYEVLDVAPLATIDEIKNAYHALALRFHPDRFHQSDPELRNKVESAFARIARAYEVLSDQSRRSDYDARRSSKTATGGEKSKTTVMDSNGAKQSPPPKEQTRAEISFQHGLDALKGNRHDEAIRFLAEAAMLSPRDARYRAHYGHALIRQPKTRRIAETELQAALTLEPENASYRVMLAELYKQLGLHRRAEGELKRALAANPTNEAARSLLLNLRTTRTQKS
jgi:curved DNA-binding protein CbpA